MKSRRTNPDLVFVDLRTTDVNFRYFAFWNRKRSQFILLNGKAAWTDWRSFKKDYYETDRVTKPNFYLSQYRKICPEWAFEVDKDADWDDDEEEDFNPKKHKGKVAKTEATKIKTQEGWLFHNPDTGVEWSREHPVDSGQVPDATDVVPATTGNLLQELLIAWENLRVQQRSTMWEYAAYRRMRSDIIAMVKNRRFVLPSELTDAIDGFKDLPLVERGQIIENLLQEAEIRALNYYPSGKGLRHDPPSLVYVSPLLEIAGDTLVEEQS